MGTSDIISIGAAIIALAALAVSVWQALQNRPILKVRVARDMLVFGAGEREGPFLVTSISNVGAQPTTILSVGYEVYKSFYSYLRRKPFRSGVATGGGYSTNLPFVLEPGREARVFTVQDRELMSDVLNAKFAFAWVSHTWADRSQRSRIPATKASNSK